MLALLAQAAPTAEWHDGWQLVVTTFTAGIGAVVAIIVWLHKQSKSDLAEVKDDLSTRITDVKDDLSARITDVKTEVVSAEARLKAEITRVETDLKADITRVENKLSADITRVEDKLSADIGEVRGDLAHLKDNLLVDALKRARNPAAAPQLSEAPPQQSPPQPKQLAETRTD